MVDNTLSCPGTPFYWKIGYRIQDTEDILPSNDWSRNIHLKGPFTWNMIQLNFCNKVNYYEDENEYVFPAGEYCVYKKGATCPPGLNEGHVVWDDEELLNSNEVHGEVPEGVYDKDTLIYFCCRDDGSYTTPIDLPTDDPFYLFQKNKDGCQQVNGMKLAEEWFHWDGEDDLFKPPNFFFGSTPHNFGRDNDHKLGFCYYYTA
ncbi:uncharacterized protein [Amphiura filiformis]|uniref:uncharacterized protein n=1 Tax=Amphiura filiformis TaxID=82378 RepID=UPI003B215D76